ncbi:unnamed protein product [Schistosoma haematobium]|nr:unnamed protein product [Schistosoma haematobium]
MVETGCSLLNYILLRDETKSRNGIGNISTIYGPISPHLCSKVSQLDARFVVESKYIFGTAYTGRGTEFEAQEQWCHLDDRLTFILLSKQLYQDYWLLNNNKTDTIESQLNNYENAEIFSMIGDVNLFITYSHMVNDFEGELSVMIAESKYRGQGLAAEALAGILEYSGRHLPMKLNSLVAKVSMTNESSIHFFQNRLNFIERSRNTIFNEIEFVPEIQQLSSEDQNQSKFKNLASNTSQLIIDRILANSLGSTSFKWYYTEKDLNLWRQTPRE